MPDRTPHTKKEKAAAVHTVMHEFKHGTLHSGSKSGPKVKGRDQAVAIAMSESGQAKKGTSMKHGKQPKPATNPGPYDTSAHTSAHHDNKAVGAKADTTPPYGKQLQSEGAAAGPVPNFVPKHNSPAGKAEHHPRAGEAHTFKPPAANNAHGYGHPSNLRKGPLRHSGHSGAHRIGKG